MTRHMQILHGQLNIDKMTRLPNFVSFFTDDFEKIYGERGTILLFKCKPIRQINDQYGFDIGDLLIVEVGKTLFQEFLCRYTCYRHEGNGFLVVLKEAQGVHAFSVIQEITGVIRKAFDGLVQGHGIEGAYLSAISMAYDHPIRSVADYYTLFYDEIMKDKEAASGKELMHYLIEGLSIKVNQMILQNQEVRQFALVDEVSNLPNSKSAKLFIEELHDESCDFGILFIDGDNLRLFNHVSYACGNQAISDLGRLIQGALRKTDQVFRWLSGDEFIVIAKQVSDQELLALAERIRSSVEMGFKGQIIEATVSIGMALSSPLMTDVYEVISAAERANKQAKLKGRNCVV